MDPSVFARRRRNRADTAAIVIVGDEILSAKTADENASFLSRELRELGVPLRRLLVVGDEVPEIAWAVREARACASFVLTTGGVGPTHDDVTVAGVAEALGRRVVRIPELESMIRDYLAAKGSALDVAETESALKMAELPEGVELVRGQGISFPVACVENVYLFPGIPSVLRRKWAAIRERFRQEPFHLSEIYVGVEEHCIARRLYDLKARYPELHLGSYPNLESSDYRVKVTLESKDESYLRGAVDALARSLEGLVLRIAGVTP